MCCPYRLVAAASMMGCLLLINLRTLSVAAGGSKSENVQLAQSPFTDFRGEAPGTMHKITPADLPPPYATRSSANGPKLVPRPADAWPHVPSGFKVEQYATNLENPRLIRTAPNGDAFVAESEPGRIKVFRGITKGGKPEKVEIFATRLKQPFGIAFYPPGPNPKYIYVGNTDSVVRFPYENGDLKARGPEEVIVPDLPGGGRLRGGGHWTRDLAFSLDGKKMFVSVGSHSNVDDPDLHPEEYHRADILAANPDGTGLRVYAWGIRNAVGIAVNSETGELWASVNERDELGDNLLRITSPTFRRAAFMAGPGTTLEEIKTLATKGKHPELKDKVIVPDVLLQPHYASLEMTFYHGKQFPPEYRGDVFAAEHGSWNKAVRAGYEVIRVPLKQGRATGEYQDFLTGFVTPEGDVWGRPVGVAVAEDGAMLVTDDGSGCIWRVSYVGK